MTVRLHIASRTTVFVSLKQLAGDTSKNCVALCVQCPKVRWAECERCQRRIAEEGLADEYELQSWCVPALPYSKIGQCST